MSGAILKVLTTPSFFRFDNIKFILITERPFVQYNDVIIKIYILTITFIQLSAYFMSLTKVTLSHRYHITLITSQLMSIELN